jgi:hypothetical protein
VPGNLGNSASYFPEARFWIVHEFASILVHSMKNCDVTLTIRKSIRDDHLGIWTGVKNPANKGIQPLCYNSPLDIA